MKKKSTRGRKPLAPNLRKVALRLYFPKYILDNAGGEKIVKEKINKLLNYA